MKYLLTILLFASCNSAKTFMLDGSQSKGNIVKWQWRVNGFNYDDTKTTSINIKRIATVELIVTDNKGRKDSTIKFITK